MVSNSNVWKFESLKVWKSDCFQTLKVWKFESLKSLKVWKFQSLNFENPVFIQCGNFKLSNFQTFKRSSFSNIQTFQTLKLSKIERPKNISSAKDSTFPKFEGLSSQKVWKVWKFESLKFPAGQQPGRGVLACQECALTPSTSNGQADTRVIRRQGALEVDWQWAGRH